MEPLDPYGEGTELSQEHPFLFVLGTAVALNCKYLCGSKQSRDCVRSTGSWAGTFPGDNGQDTKESPKKKKIPWFSGKIPAFCAHWEQGQEGLALLPPPPLGVGGGS